MISIPIFRDLSARRKLTLIVVIPMVTALLFVSVAFAVIDITMSRKDVREEIASTAKVLGDNCRAALTFDDPGSAEATLSALRADEDIMFAQVFNAKGALFATYERDDIHHEPLEPGPPGVYFVDGWLRVFEPIVQDGEVIGTIAMQSDMSALTSRVKLYAFVGLPLVLCSLCLGFTVVAMTRKRAEAAVRESEEKFRALVETMNDWVWEVDRSGVFTYSSPKVKDLLGYEVDEVIGKPAFDFMPPEEAARVAVFFQNGVQSPQPFAGFESANRHANGRLVTIETSGAPFFDANGDLAGFRGIIRDISERKRAEGEREQLLHDLKERVKEMDCLYGVAEIVEQEGVSLDAIYQETANILPAAWQYPEITCAQIVMGDRAFESPRFVASDWQQSTDIRVGGTVVGKVVVAYLEERPTLDEGPFLEEERLLLEAIADHLGRITERKRAEVVLREREELFSAISESAQDAIVMVDNDGKVTHWNGSAKRIFQYTSEEVLGRPLQDFLIPESLRGAHREAFSKFRATGQGAVVGKTIELPGLRKDGAEIPVEISFSATRVQGQWHAVGIMRDITDRKQAEEERDELLELVSESNDTLTDVNARLAQSNRELEDFAFVASHDLQEPLRKIAAFGDRLKAACGDRLNDQERDYVARMQSAASRMRGLIEDLLTFSRITSHAKAFEPVDLNEVVREVLSDLDPMIQGAGARVDVDTLPVIDADPTQMRQLLQNLVGNALKYRKPGLTPQVSIRAQMRGVAGNGEHCEITVEDNGIGFDEKYLDRIFGMFQRLHGRGEYEGTGIGLAVCRKIVERHRGTITAKSAPDHGALFLVVLPAHQKEKVFSHE